MPSLRRLLIVAGLCILAAACGGHTPVSPTPPPVVPPPVEPPPPPPTPVLGITRILAFGDSLTEGTTQPAYTFGPLTAGLPVSYPFKLGTMLSDEYRSQQIVTLNAGKAGESAADPRTQDRFGAMVSEGEPEVVLLMEGANDLNNIPAGGSISAAIATTANAIEDMVREAVERRHVKVLLATLPPQRAGGSRAGAVTFLGRYNDALKQLAAKKGATLVDVNAQFPLSLIGQDGLHPTDAGYDKLAQIFRDAIVSAYDATPTPAR
jgi:lysophospholipase L1-like esterase